MAILYILMLLVGMGVFAKRGLAMNVWWVAFYSTAIYSLPVAFGRTAFQATLGTEAAAMMLLVMFACLACSLLSRPSVRREGQANSPHRTADRYVPHLLVLACFVSFALLLFIYGTGIFYVHKVESGISGQFYIFWRLTSTLAVIACLIARRWRLLCVALVPLCATLFAGDRTAVGITVIAAVWLSLKGKQVRPHKTFAIVLSAIALGVFLFFGKTFQAQWASGTFTSISDLAVSVADQGIGAVVRTEPFAVAGVLDALIGLPQAPSGSLFLEVAAQFLIFPSYFGFESSSFNDFFQPILFPGFRERSMAYSFWGEGFVRGGWIGFASFLGVYLFILRLLDRMTNSSHLLVRVASYVGGSYWAFYIHRNSMVSIIAYERQIVVFCLVIFITAYLFRSFNRMVNSVGR